MKPLNIFSGIAPLGTLLEQTMSLLWDFIVFVVPSGQIIFYIVDGFFGTSIMVFSLLSSLHINYDPLQFYKDLHQMYLDILLQRHQTSQVLQQVPSTPIQQHFSSLISVSSESPIPSPVFVDTP